MFLRFLGFASVFQGILLFGNWVVFSTVVHLFNIQEPVYIESLRWSFIIFSWSFIAAWLLVSHKFSKPRNIFYYASSAYLGVGHFLVVASFAFWIFEAVNLLFSLGFPSIEIGKLLLAWGLGAGVYGIWNSYQIKVKIYTVKLPNLPKAWEGKKIVMFADSHLGNIRGVKFAKKIVELINRQNPEIVLIPGDYYDGPPADFKALAHPLTAIKSERGVYFSTGNHEEFRKNHPFLEALAQAGVKILSNDFVEIDGLQILGVDFHSTRGNRKFRKVLHKINFDPAKPSVLMKHVPSSLTAASEARVSLMVSGHTHRAQVFPANLLTKIIFKGYDYGLKPFGNTQVLTTSGVGTWGPPQRVGTNSEIVVIVLQ